MNVISCWLIKSISLYFSVGLEVLAGNSLQSQEKDHLTRSHTQHTNLNHICTIKLMIYYLINFEMHKKWAFSHFSPFWLGVVHFFSLIDRILAQLGGASVLTPKGPHSCRGSWEGVWLAACQEPFHVLCVEIQNSYNPSFKPASRLVLY